MSPTDVDVQQHDPELPAGWARAKFGESYELVYGKSLTKAARNTDGDFPVYGSNGIVGHHDTFLVEGPVLVVGRKGAAGAVSFSTKPCWPIDTTYYVRDSEHIDIRFSFYLLTSLRLNQFDRSTAIPGLNRDDAYKLVVDLPPLSEQHRIVAKIEELFSELDKGVESLNTAQGQLNVYRAKPSSRTPSKASSRRNGAKRTKTSLRRPSNYSLASNRSGRRPTRF